MYTAGGKKFRAQFPRRIERRSKAINLGQSYQKKEFKPCKNLSLNSKFKLSAQAKNLKVLQVFWVGLTCRPPPVSCRYEDKGEFPGAAGPVASGALDNNDKT